MRNHHPRSCNRARRRHRVLLLRDDPRRSVAVITASLKPAPLPSPLPSPSSATLSAVLAVGLQAALLAALPSAVRAGHPTHRPPSPSFVLVERV